MRGKAGAGGPGRVASSGAVETAPDKLGHRAKVGSVSGSWRQGPREGAQAESRTLWVSLPGGLYLAQLCHPVLMTKEVSRWVGSCAYALHMPRSLTP